MAIVYAVDLLTEGSACVHALPYEDYLFESEMALKEVLTGSPTKFLMNQTIWYFRPKELHKRAALAEVLRRLKDEGERTSWVLSIGDNQTDDDMLTELYRSSREKDMVMNTCTVGRKTTAAKYYVDGVDDILDLLDVLRPP
ncbi:unnamed protein product [Agarophyton chilense]